MINMMIHNVTVPTVQADFKSKNWPPVQEFIEHYLAVCYREECSLIDVHHLVWDLVYDFIDSPEGLDVVLGLSSPEARAAIAFAYLHVQDEEDKDVQYNTMRHHFSLRQGMAFEKLFPAIKVISTPSMKNRTRLITVVLERGDRTVIMKSEMTILPTLCLASFAAITTIKAGLPYNDEAEVTIHARRVIKEQLFHPHWVSQFAQPVLLVDGQ